MSERVVYLLSRGERGEGAVVLGAFASFDAARAAAAEHWVGYARCGMPVSTIMPTWSVIAEGRCAEAHMNRVDYLQVSTMAVQGEDEPEEAKRVIAALLEHVQHERHDGVVDAPCPGCARDELIARARKAVGA